MLSHANFLILDEPTNHLDIQSKEILESAMNAYTGTIFMFHMIVILSIKLQHESWKSLIMD